MQWLFASAMYRLPRASSSQWKGWLSVALPAGPPSPVWPALPVPATVAMVAPGWRLADGVTAVVASRARTASQWGRGCVRMAAAFGGRETASVSLNYGGARAGTQQKTPFSARPEGVP